jgi:hypothetical protein
MRKASRVLPALFAMVLAAPGIVSVTAQDRERFVISAKAGGINAVTGRTGVHAQGSSEWEQLTIKDNLEAGDVVKTGGDGRVEMLLNPGSYLRVAENTEFELTNNSLDNLEVRLIRGTAIVEATGADDTEMMINITTPHTKMAIIRRGLYRVKVVPGDVTELIVRKGRVLLADSQTKIKGGRKLVFSGLTFTEAKLDKADKQSDNFDSWSKERAETIAQVNRKIRSRDVNLLLASFNDPWSVRSSYGLWLFHPRFGCYTFLPFYYGWGSPYGSSYPNYFYANYYWYYGRPDVRRNTASYPRGSSSTSGNTGTSGSGGSRSFPQAAPPRQMPSSPSPMSRPERSMPRAAEGKVLRSGDRLPN